MHSLPTRVLEENPALPRELKPTIPRALEAICLKAMAKRPEQRYQTASGLARAYESGSKEVALHDVMLSMQKANISFQSAVQVRNRLVSAYHDIMNMQI